jgi:hypothetical protein
LDQLIGEAAVDRIYRVRDGYDQLYYQRRAVLYMLAQLGMPYQLVQQHYSHRLVECWLRTIGSLVLLREESFNAPKFSEGTRS